MFMLAKECVMFRATNWITPLTISTALACAASSLHAENTKQSPRAVDYVVELPAEDDAEMEEDFTSEDFEAEAPLPLDKPSDESSDATDSSSDDTELIKERYPNGAIRIERRVTQDAQGNYINHGPWKMWDERGNLMAQGQYEYGNRTGVWIRWYRSVQEANLLSKAPYSQYAGPYISQATFKNDLLDGVWTIYDGKTRKISQWAFSEGKRHGPSLWWYANGKKMREANFTNGDMDGPYLEWAPDGTLRVKEEYQEGRKLAMKTTYYTGNVKKSEGMYLFAKDIEHSPDDWWNCKLVTTVKTGKDEKHGLWTSWFASGQMQLQGRYEHDLQVGKFTWWHSNGQRALEGNFDRGKQDGQWTWWHANGQKSIEGHYAAGNPTGRWTWWKEDGRVVQSADLSHSEGVVIETPRELEVPIAAPSAPAATAKRPAAGTRSTNPARRPPVVR
jgi:antitoxin component YwqK of YwqJK toxin-antitoxin module